MSSSEKDLEDEELIEQYIKVSRFMVDNKEKIQQIAEEDSNEETREKISEYVEENAGFSIKEIGQEIEDRASNPSFQGKITKKLKEEFTDEELQSYFHISEMDGFEL